MIGDHSSIIILIMSYILNKDKQIKVIHLLARGASIRSIEDTQKVHRDTIMRLGVKVGHKCQLMLDKTMKNIKSNKIQVDEIWGFVKKKEKNVKPGEQKVGSVWTFVAMDPETKLAPCYRIGKRDGETASAFIADLASRLANRVQLSSDGLAAYIEAVEKGFDEEVDYAQVVKTYTKRKKDVEALEDVNGQQEDKTVDVKKTIIIGNPIEKDISTSLIERQNLTMRIQNRRLTRKTNGFSKKHENFEASIGLYFACYNFVNIHSTLRVTPAMEAGVTDRLWEIGDLVEL